MSATIDTNVLVYASNSRDPRYAGARALVERLAGGPEILYLFWPVLLGYLRLVTHPGILREPLSHDEAAGNVERLVARRHVTTAGEQDGFWLVYRGIATTATRGNDIPDAHIAALMHQHGVRRIYTSDRAFRQFDGIEAVNPVD